MGELVHGNSVGAGAHEIGLGAFEGVLDVLVGSVGGLAGLGIVEAAGELLKEGGANCGREFLGAAAAVGRGELRC